MPLLNNHVTPTGTVIRVDPSAHLARLAELRAEALATVPADAEQEMDRETYLRHLAETEAGLRGGQ